LYPINYYLVSPGVAEDIAPMVNIKADSYATAGKIMLTTVSMKRANLIDYFWVKLFKPELYELQSMDFLPEDVDLDEYFNLMQEMMTESQLKAKAVALKEVGYQPQITGQGVKIVQVLEKSDGYGRLKEGDIIVGVDGTKVQLLTETVNKIQDRELGDKVEVTVKREEEKKRYTIKTKALQQNSEQPSIGVLITPYKRKYNFPIQIEINAGKIGGPSAGSMFALEIYNGLTEDDITQGSKIAGTGTINLDGTIGPIDGIKQKIAAAKKEEAQLFFVPAGNWETAQEMKKKDLKLVRVENFVDIINYLTQES
ncbi:MAG: PDZ domain-containing protein, partial [Halanaerobacter sp.]